MNVTEYEEHVASILRREGWTAVVSPPTGDGGVDVIAERS
jgi:Holliday junction resolvase